MWFQPVPFVHWLLIWELLSIVKRCLIIRSKSSLAQYPAWLTICVLLHPFPRLACALQNQSSTSPRKRWIQTLHSPFFISIQQQSTRTWRTRYSNFTNRIIGSRIFRLARESILSDLTNPGDAANMVISMLGLLIASLISVVDSCGACDQEWWMMNELTEQIQFNSILFI